jgi:hypothetical protein
MSAIKSLTPQMAEFSERFTHNGDIRWLPYIMYFNPPNYNSPVISTDSKGFRFSRVNGISYSASEHRGVKNTRLLAGNSMVFGMGATSDEWTLSSRMSARDPKESHWINFGSVGFNSTQELLLMVLYGHLLPKIDEIVLISGFNNLGLARLPSELRGENGAFFNISRFFKAMSKTRSSLNSVAAKVLESVRRVRYTSETPSMDSRLSTFTDASAVADQIDYAADLTLRHLDMWRVIAAGLNVKLTFMLQPLATWVRPTGSPEEIALFAELDETGQFTEGYGDVLGQDVGRTYASKLQVGTSKVGIDFVDLNPLLRRELKPDQWVYTDRIHFTDAGHDLLAGIVLNAIR